MAGLVIIGTMLALAVLAPLIAPYDPNHQDLTQTPAGAVVAALAGYRQLGRDVWSRLLYGARVDLRVAFLAVCFPFIIGTVLGCIAGYYGGWADTASCASWTSSSHSPSTC